MGQIGRRRPKRGAKHPSPRDHRASKREPTVPLHPSAPVAHATPPEAVQPDPAEAKPTPLPAAPKPPTQTINVESLRALVREDAMSRDEDPATSPAPRAAAETPPPEASAAPALAVQAAVQAAQAQAASAADCSPAPALSPAPAPSTAPAPSPAPVRAIPQAPRRTEIDRPHSAQTAQEQPESPVTPILETSVAEAPIGDAHPHPHSGVFDPTLFGDPDGYDAPQLHSAPQPAPDPVAPPKSLWVPISFAAGVGTTAIILGAWFSIVGVSRDADVLTADAGLSVAPATAEQPAPATAASSATLVTRTAAADPVGLAPATQTAATQTETAGADASGSGTPQAAPGNNTQPAGPTTTATRLGATKLPPQAPVLRTAPEQESILAALRNAGLDTAPPLPRSISRTNPDAGAPPTVQAALPTQSTSSGALLLPGQTAEGQEDLLSALAPRVTPVPRTRPQRLDAVANALGLKKGGLVPVRLPASDGLGPYPARPDLTQIAPGPKFDTSGIRLAVYAPVTLRRAEYNATVDGLNAIGMTSVKVGRTPHTIRNDNVRFYHERDREIASVIAAALDARMRDFTNVGRKPDTGTIEVWLSGRGAPRVVEGKRENGLQRSLRRLADRLASLGKQN